MRISISNNRVLYDKISDKMSRMLRLGIILGVIWYLANFLSKLIISPINDWVKFAIMLSLALPLILFAKPVWSFMALIFTRPLLEPLWQYRFIGGGSILGIFSFLYVIIGVYLLLKDREFKVLHDKIKWYYYFIFISLVSFFNTPDLATSVTITTRYITLLMIFLISYNITNNTNDALKIIRVMVMSSVIPIIYGIYQVITGTGVQVYKEFQSLAGVARVNSFFNLSNGFAYFLGLMSFLIIFFIYNSKRKGERIYYLLILLGALVCQAHTHVRTVWLAFIIGMCVLGVYNKKIGKYFVLIAVISMPFTYEILINRFTDLVVKPEYGTSSLEFRSDLAKQLLVNAFPKHMFIGFGTGVAEMVSTKYTVYREMPHNDYLKLLIETGIAGLIAYVFFIGKILIYLYDLIKKKINVHENLVFFTIIVFHAISSAGQNLFSQIVGSGYVFCLLGLIIKINEISMKSGDTIVAN